MTQTSVEEIHYSPQNIRWFYGNNKSPNSDKLRQITELLPSWHGKNVEMRSITKIIYNEEIEREPDSVAPWQPIQEDPIEIFQIQNLQILDNDLTFNGFSRIDSIEIKALDFDPNKNQLVVYLPDTKITENFHTPPKTRLSENSIRYVFTLK
ncbi:hypothetical protein H6G96_38180 [Nostoc sp. FACHB-892]|uniref:hypothetical protein n=1 Tax=Nostoc sp. FACHB-892 TaxID=2692843 RepID=UPI001684820A|nr:hypothetical protein [Nostoc sp. FACHB-892]MBD2731938.1 hypothetical protein [Nostoc sp. FACHB-892]